MSDSVTVNVHGLKELAMALQQMPEKLAGKALGASVKAGANLVRDAARDLVPVDTGAVKKSIVAYRKPGSRPTNIAYEVGVTMKKKFPRGKDKNWPAFYWRFLEFGTSKMAAKPFLRPAWVRTKDSALWMIKNMLAKAVVIAAAQVPKYRG